MSILAEETARIVESLPPDKAQALLEYARYLADKADEERWQQQFNDPKYRLKLQQLAEEALAEFRSGQTQPLDPNKM